MTSAECDSVNDNLLKETGRIGVDIYNKVVGKTPWISLTPRDTWPDGMGDIISNLTWERTLPTNTGDEWANYVASTGAAPDACLPTPEIVHFGQTTQTMRIQRRAIQTEEFCVEDLRGAFELKQMLTNVRRNLSDVTRYVWETRNQDEYIRIAKHKITETSTGGFDINATEFDVNDPPTSKLLNATLEQIYAFLDLEGIDGVVGRTMQDAAVYNLITDMFTSRDLIRQDPELRQDFRFAYEGVGKDSPLLKVAGSSLSYNGFKHTATRYPPRWDIVGGAWTRRFPFKDPEATTKGVKQEVQPVYIYAEFQDSVVHVPGVYTQRVPKAITAPGGGFMFNAVNYMGDFAWLNIQHKICNPRKTKGFFDAIFASASEPVHPEYGWVIRHKNCGSPRTQRSCYS